MSTENGVAPASKARRHVATLERRLTFLCERVAVRPDRDNAFDHAEIAALTWALPVLEAEADDLSRLRSLCGFKVPS